MEDNNFHNLHISITDLRYETRLIKETSSLKKSNIFNSITIVALHSDGLEEYETLNNGSEIRRIKLFSKRLPASLFFQIFKYFEFLSRILIIAFKNPPRAINVHSLSLLPIGFIIKILFKSKFIYDTHELETEVFGLTGIKKSLAKILEKIFIKSCDLIIVVGPKIKEWYEESYGIENIVVVLNCPRLSKKANKGKLRKIFDISPSKKIAIYIGNLDAGRGLKEILSAFSKTDRNDMVVVFMGYGIMQEEIISYTKKHDNIFYKEAVPPDDVLSFASDADLGFCLIENTCLNDYFSLPNKLFEYAMSYTPLVCSPMIEIEVLMRNYQIGEILGSNFEKTMWASINKILEYGNIDDRFKKFNEEFSWGQQETVLIEAYKTHIL